MYPPKQKPVKELYWLWMPASMCLLRILATDPPRFVLEKQSIF